MENFPHLAYKKPEYQNTRPEKPSQEKLRESLVIAQGKLAKITTPDFRDFSVRFMNLEEYRMMVEEGKFGGDVFGEVVKHGPEGSDASIHETFEEFLENYNRRTIKDYTDWELSGHQLGAERIFAEYDLRSLIAEKKPRKETLDKLRLSIIDALKDPSGLLEGLRLEDLIDQGSFMYLENSDTLAQNLTFLSSEQKDKLDYLDESGQMSLDREFGSNKNEERAIWKYLRSKGVEQTHGKENLDVLRRMIDDPEYIQQPGVLRQILTALSYAFDMKSFDIGKQRQYHIAVILDNETFGFQARGFGSLPHRQWASFDDGGLGRGKSTKDQGKGILAAVSLSRLKNQYEEMRNLTEGFGDFAHPIFQIVGSSDQETQRVLLRWPKSTLE
jgi:hypothetical protein